MFFKYILIKIPLTKILTIKDKSRVKNITKWINLCWYKHNVGPYGGWIHTHVHTHTEFISVLGL